MLNYNHLYYFHVAATEGSIGSAATRLGVTQPTVSEQLRTLERALGVTLFQRHSAGLRLSEAGRVAFEHTQVMFGVGERLVKDLTRAATPPVRTLRIGISGLVSRSTSGRFLLPLLSLDCRPIVRLVECAQLLEGLREGELDLVLCESKPADPERGELEVRTLERTPLVVIAHPALELGGDWRDLSLLHYSTGSRLRSAVDAFLDRRGLQPRISAEADDALLLLEAVATGRYVAVVPESIARDAVAAGRVRVVEALAGEEAQIHAIYRSGETAQLAQRAVDTLAQSAIESIA